MRSHTTIPLTAPTPRQSARQSIRKRYRQLNRQLIRSHLMPVALGAAALAVCPSLTLGQPGKANFERFNWHGVLTQGAIHTSDYNLYGKSKNDVSFDFTELSLAANYQLNSAFRLTGQGIYRHGGGGFDGADIDYLFISYDNQLIENHYTGLEIGRIKNTIGLYNATRDIAFTRTSIYLPPSTYRDSWLRDVMVSVDGIRIYHDIFLATGTLGLDIAYGAIRDDDFTEIPGALSADFSETTYDFDNFLLAKMQFTDASQSYTFAVSFARLPFTVDNIYDLSTIPGISLLTSPFIPPSFTDLSSALQFQSQNNTTLHIRALSFQWLGQYWRIASEYGQYHVEFAESSDNYNDLLDNNLAFNGVDLSVRDLLTAFSEVKQISEFFYVQLTRALTPRVEASARIDVAYDAKDDRDGSNAEAQGLGLDHTRFAYDYMLAIRYTPKNNILLEAEIHYIDGTTWLNPADNPEADTNPDRYWTAVAFSASFRF